MESIKIDELIRSKRKSVSLIVTNDARLIVRAPLRLSLKSIEKLVERKKDWILDKMRVSAEKHKKTADLNFKDGGAIPFLGSMLRLESSSAVRSAKQTGDRLLFPSCRKEGLELLLKRWYQKQAKDILSERLRNISLETGIPYEGLRITSARRRWGSCNSKNHVHFTWRLVMATPKAIDYVIVHELCHVLHKNHSKTFWNQVEAIMPDYRERRKWLRENSHILDAL